MAEQEVLLQIPEQPEQVRLEQASGGSTPKLRPINRRQQVMGMIDVEELIGEDHKARAIWSLTGSLDLSGFLEPIRSQEGSAGRSAWDPRLLVSTWLYAYSEGIGSAREIERVMEWEPGLRWLSGLEVINHHTLSDFRIDHKAGLDGLFAQLLAVLEQHQLVDLERVMHDGTRVRARAGADTFRREKTLRERLKTAEDLVRQMGDPAAENMGSRRREAAQARARREQEERLQRAVEELKQLQAASGNNKPDQELRVSLTEPEARVMKHGDGGYQPSYNLQVSTDAKQKVIVAVSLSQSASDSGLLEKAVETVEETTGKKPSQMVVDGGFVTRPNIQKMADQQIDLIAPLPNKEGQQRAALESSGIDAAFGPPAFAWDREKNLLVCPAGKQLAYRQKGNKRGVPFLIFRARAADCSTCEFRSQCCPNHSAHGRMVSLLQEEERVLAFQRKMQTEQAKAIYKQRGPVAEFPNAWIKDILGLRKFRVSGLVKASTEALWVCLTYNVLIWRRLVWLKGPNAA